MALPREVREANKIDGLRNRLGKNGFIGSEGKRHKVGSSIRSLAAPFS
jgi:hypothetical protein